MPIKCVNQKQMNKRTKPKKWINKIKLIDTETVNVISKGIGVREEHTW